MKNFRATLIFALLVAALVAFTIWDSKRAEHAQETKQEASRLLKFTPERVTSIEILGQGVLTKLEKSGDAWKLLSPVEDAADAEVVSSTLSSLGELKSIETVVEGENIDPKIYGLDQPSYTLTVTSSEGKREQITVGSVNAFDSNLYAQIDTEKKVLLVPPALKDDLSKPVREYRNKRLYRGETDLKFDTIEIALREKNRKSDFALVKRESGGWEIKGVGDALALSDESVEAYLRQLRELRATDFTGESASDPKALQKNGLASPELQVRLLEAGQLRFELKASALPQTTDAAVAIPVASSDVKEIAKALPSGVGNLKKGPEEFFDKKAPFRFTMTDVSRMSIRAPELSGEFEKHGDDWDWADKPGKGSDKGLQKPVDSAKLKALVERLSKLEAARILGPVKTAAPLKKPASIELQNAKGEKLLELVWGEKVTEKTQGDVEATFYPARTNQSGRVIMLTSAAIEGMDLAALAASKDQSPKLSPTPSP